MINKNKTMSWTTFPSSTKNKQGFTLVELLVVVAIIVTLSVVAIVSLGGETNKARDARRLSDIASISSALQSYQLENGTYPVALADMPRSLISNIPRDPGRADHPYLYATGSGGTTFALAATLEGDGNPEQYATHFVTNDDADILLSDGSVGYYNAAGTLTACNPGAAITDGEIGIVPAGNCIPYDPNNP